MYQKKTFSFSIVMSVLMLIFCFQSFPVNIQAITEEDSEKLIALTFDDGPNTTTTNDVLDVLETYNAVGSFFLIGDNINDESAETVRRAYNMGCEIDNHSKTHSYMSTMTEEELQAEVGYVDEKVYEITGEYPHFFRPPYIATSQTMYDVIDLPFICGFDCKDFDTTVTAEARTEAILNAAKDGLIVLLHDAAGNNQTVEALKTIIPTLQEEGYKFVTLSQLFEQQNETPKGNLIYSEVAKYPCDNYSIYREIFSGEATGESGWSGWGDKAVLDNAELEQLGDTYAIEVEYDSTLPPVVALQAWSDNTFWQSVLPYYYNGERACFLASDINKILEENNIKPTDLDKISIMPYGGTMTLTKVNLLVSDIESEYNTSKFAGLKRYLLGISETVKDEYDVNESGDINCFDAILYKHEMMQAK